MAIPLKKESDDLGKEFGCYENCVFCNVKSLYWHEKTNNCICQDCAKTHKAAELTNWLKPTTQK